MVGELNEGERLVKLEVEVSAIKEAVFEMKTMMINQHDNYVTKGIMDEKIKSLEKDIQILRKEFDEQREDKRTHKGVLPLWIAIVPSIIVVVVELINLTHK